MTQPPLFINHMRLLGLMSKHKTSDPQEALDKENIRYTVVRGSFLNLKPGNNPDNLKLLDKFFPVPSIMKAVYSNDTKAVLLVLNAREDITVCSWKCFG